jgi:dihydrofolate reductase
MRKLVAYTLMALDGAVDDPSLIFTPSDDPDEPFLFDEECEAFELETITTQDSVLLGRNMYDEWRGYWPGVRNNPFAEFINPVRKHVLTSRPIEEGEWSDAEPLSGPLSEAIGRLRNQDGGDIGVHGSIRLVQSLLAEDLLDELRLVVSPVVGLPGRRLFADLPQPRRLRLLRQDVTSGDNLLLTYARRG